MSGLLYHTVAAGDRWDLLADAYYGNPHAFGRIQRANPEVSHLPEPPEGLILLIPVIEIEGGVTDGAPAMESYSPWGI